VSFQWITRFNNISSVTPKARAGAQAAIQKAIAATIQAADPLTPVDTGALKANKAIVVGSLQGSVTWIQEYGIYQEEGTIHIAGKHFARNGSEQARPTFIAEMTAVGFKLA
jgi:hypothetical protein